LQWASADGGRTAAVAGELVAAVVWLWEFRSPSGRILSKGDYHARPYASPADIAAERMALLVHHRLGKHPGWSPLEVLTSMAGMVCRVWREDCPEEWGEDRADEWIRTVRGS
jgi:hypothetical protein